MHNNAIVGEKKVQIAEGIQLFVMKYNTNKSNKWSLLGNPQFATGPTTVSLTREKELLQLPVTQLVQGFNPTRYSSTVQEHMKINNYGVPSDRRV